MSVEYIFLLVFIFFVIAIFYSASGFGGGSSYLATLALFPIEFTSLRLIALLCNIAVVSGSSYLFYKSGLLKIKRLIPLIGLSIPMAFLGGSLKIESQTFFIILGLTLLVASISMLFSSKVGSRKLPTYSNAIIGGGIGFLSGMVGIGGGIFLSPILHISQWSKPKVIAATTALFILVNSTAGLIGQVLSNDISIESSLIFFLLVAVFLGGQIGSRLTIQKLNPLIVKKITAILILSVSIRILYQYLF